MKNSFQAPSVTRMKTCNWDNIGGVHKKVKRTMFVSVLERLTKGAQVLPEVQAIRNGILAKQAEKKHVSKLREINQALGGNTCGKVIFCKNGAMQIKGRGFVKNPLSA